MTKYNRNASAVWFGPNMGVSTFIKQFLLKLRPFDIMCDFRIAFATSERVVVVLYFLQDECIDTN